MPRKIALKRLTASDLTFFEWHFRNHPAGKQKAINLNANILVDRLYPNLPEVAEEQNGRIPVDLFIYGPGLAGELNLQRKIVKHGAYKNWRLNGELIYDPVESPERFQSLAPGDFVILSFVGNIYPHSAKLVFITRNTCEDKSLHAALDSFLGDEPMMDLGLRQLEQLINQATPTDAHPIYELISDTALEDAALGGIEGIKKIRRRPSNRRISRDSLEQARQKAGKVGQLGESYVNAYLYKRKHEGEIQDFEWVSRENAISPYDFTVLDNQSGKVLVDVKSTEGTFENPIHVSFNELLTMIDEAQRYDIYRVFEIEERQAKLCIATDVGSLAKQIVDTTDKLPEGVSLDGVSILPSSLNFEEHIVVELPDQIDEEA